MKIKTGVSQKAVDHFQPDFVCKILNTRKIKLNGMMLVAKMAAKPIYML